MGTRDSTRQPGIAVKYVLEVFERWIDDRAEMDERASLIG